MKTQEGRIITENPLRILGVYSDTPKKEIVANLGKMRAFSKTGKALSFDSDFTSLLGPVNRTKDTIEKANNDISLPKDKLQAGLFWFMQHTDNDKAALEYLKTGDSKKALKIIQKKGNYSSTINMAVLALVLKKWDLALYSYSYLLESEYRKKAFIRSFTDTDDCISENELVEYISNKLIQEFPNVNWIEQIHHDKIELEGNLHPFNSRFVGSKLFEQLTDKRVTQIKREIDSVLDMASSLSRKDANANLKMAEFMEGRCKAMLKELRLTLGKDNKKYIKYADEIANQILENCISYYNNDGDNPNRARNVVKFVRYSYRTAESQITKERAKKNLDILEEEIENQIPESIEDEFAGIDKLVKNYHDTRSKINNTHQLVAVINEAFELINSIKVKLGKDNKRYMSISSNFVHFAIQEVVNEINSISNITTYLERSQYEYLVKWGKSIFNSLILFDKDEECQKSFSDNFNILNELAQKIIDKPVPPKPKVTQTSNSNIQSSSTKSKKSNTYSYTNYKQAHKKQTESTNSSALAYIFGGICMIFVVIMIVMTLSNKQKKDNIVAKIPDSEYSTDYSEKNTDNVNANSYDADETYAVETESSTVYRDETETSSTLSSDNTTSYDNEIESFTTISFSTGDRPYQSTYGKGNYDSNTQNSLIIKNGSSTDAVVFLERLNGKKIRHVFIARGQNFTMTNVPGGQYIIKVMQGTDWNPEKDNGSGNPKGGFMYSCSISKSESYDAFDYPYPSSGQYGQYEVTLYKVQNGNMQTESINENDLF